MCCKYDFFHGKISQLKIFFNSTSCTGLSVVLIKVRSKMHVKGVGVGGSTTKTTRNLENLVLWSVFCLFFVCFCLWKN